MRCEDMEKLLDKDAFDARALTAEERRHVEKCRRCARRFKAELAAREGFKALRSLTFPVDVTNKVMESIHSLSAPYRHLLIEKIQLLVPAAVIILVSSILLSLFVMKEYLFHPTVLGIIGTYVTPLFGLLLTFLGKGLKLILTLLSAVPHKGDILLFTMCSVSLLTMIFLSSTSLFIVRLRRGYVTIQR